METPTFEELRSLVAEHASPCDVSTLHGETRVVHDLEIMGDDFPELLLEINRRYGTDFSDLRWTDYAPSEGELLTLLPMKRRILARCRSMTLGQLHEAIASGKWSEDKDWPERRFPDPRLTYFVMPLVIVAIGVLLLAVRSLSR